MWQRSLAFVRKAGTLILAISVVVWALSALPGGDVDSSYLAAVGRWLEPVGRVMGMDWRLMVALLTSFIAKENTIATLAVLFGAGTEVGLAQALAAAFPASSALAFLAVQMLFVPCVATVAAVRQETGSWRWTLLNLAFLLFLSLAAGTAVYWLARLAGL